MNARHDRDDRRTFLAGASALGAASVLGMHRSDAAERPPEITNVRIAHWSTICTDRVRLIRDHVRSLSLARL
jgi:hypothetical protein